MDEIVTGCDCFWKGHSYGDWVVTKEPTFDAVGEETSTCSKYGNTQTRWYEGDIIIDCESLGMCHTRSAADHDQITRGESFCFISCLCGRGVRGSNRDDALAKFNAHVAEGLYDYCGQIRFENDGHYHNTPSITVVCIECGKTVANADCYRNCPGDGLACCYG